MKKKFTFLMAALMLLTMMVLPWKAVGQTYTQLSSIADIDENAQYVLGTYESSTYYFHYSGTSSWGTVATPASQTPYYYSLTKGANNANCTASIVIDNTTYYLSVDDGSNAWSMPTNSTTIYINEGLIYKASTATTRFLQRNSNLRSYKANDSYPDAHFYKVTQTITFNGNEGSYNNGSSYTQSVNRNYQTALTANQFVRDGYNFDRWTTNQDGTGTTYTNGQNVTLTSDLTLYAQWNANTEPNISASDVDLLVSATSGSIAYTINNEPVGGGAVTAAITAGNVGSWLSLGTVTSSSVALTCSANEGAERSATVTLTYTYNTDQTVTKVVTVTQATSTRTVTYQANNGTTDNVVITYDYGTDVTVFDYDDDEIDFTAPTGKVFKNWKENNTTYVAGDEILSIDDNHILVAQWEDLPTYSLVTSNDDLICGKHYIIVGSRTVSNKTKHYAMGSQKTNNRNAVEVAIDNNTIEAVADICEFVISGPETIKKNNQDVTVYTIYDVAGNGYLYAAGSGSNNHLKTEASLDDNGKWTIAIGATTNVATITAQGSNTNNKLKKNNSSDLFSCYSSGQNDVYLYKKDDDNDCHIYSNTTLSDNLSVTGDMTIHSGVVTVAANKTLTVNGTLTNTTAANLVINNGGQLITNNAVNATVKKDIEAWATDPIGGWYLIASPIVASGGIATDEVDNLVPSDAENYDLYRLNYPTWENHKDHSEDFVLNNGEGYLYAINSATSLVFSGTVKPSEDDLEVGNASATYSLVGNPYTCNAYIRGKSHYKMNATRTYVEATGVNTAIAPCEGVVVEGAAVFTTTEPAKANQGGLQMVLTQAVANSNTRGESVQTLDNAIVSFNEGSELGKFYFGQQNANIYIPRDNKEYAIVSAEACGEMPVCFKAAQDGQYTITVNPEEVEMGYLHLIDNIAGTDIDLLQTPSYTFSALNDDYESRFRLVFSANGMNNENGNDDFAFISNGQLIIANNGEATLQVVDITGSILSSEVINGSCSKTINAASGVYVLRLVNGSNVKTQKIVVR